MPGESQFCLLGPLLIRSGGQTLPALPGKQRALLAALLLRANRMVPLEDLAEAAWGSAAPTSARGTLRHYVKELRKALAGTGGSRIETVPGGYLIRIGPAELDVLTFEELRAEALQAAGEGAWDRAAEYWRVAAALWRGEALADVASDWLALREIPRLTEMRLQAVEGRIEADLHRGRQHEVIPDLRQLATVHPLRERLHAMLMLALYRDGQQAQALAAYQVARQVLKEAVGAEPGSELRDLQRQILAVDPALAAPDRSEAARQAADQVVPRELPAPVRHFAGRSGELAVLAGLLAQAGPDTRPAVVISAIGGLAGVGKTALAVQFAHRVAGSFPDGQLYVNLRGFDPVLPPMPASEAIRLALDAFQIPAGQIPASAEAQAGLYRTVLAGKKVLIVADNAADAGQVRPLLPGSPGCLVIVTSRSQLAGLVATDGAIPMKLDVLTEAEARDLLASILGDARVAVEPEAAGQLIELCGRLPLALAITAARAATSPGLPLAALAAELTGRRGPAGCPRHR